MSTEPEPAPVPPPALFALPTPVPQLGLPTDKFSLDAQYGRVALAVKQALDTVIESKATLDGLTNQDLLDRGYTDTQIAQFRSGMNDLRKLADVFYGVVEGGAVYDYTQFAKFLWGVGI